MSIRHIPLWVRQTIYVGALVVLVPAVAFGWTSDSVAAQITVGLSVALAPGLALANMPEKKGRHRAR